MSSNAQVMERLDGIEELLRQLLENQGQQISSPARELEIREIAAAAQKGDFSLWELNNNRAGGQGV